MRYEIVRRIMDLNIFVQPWKLSQDTGYHIRFSKNTSLAMKSYCL